MKRSNCLLWAVAMKWRRWCKGKKGRIRYRQSYYGWFPHFLYIERHRTVSYVPIDPKHKTCPPPIFMGRVRYGDAVPTQKNPSQ